jgi:site-specific recombinase XerD
MKHLSDYLEPEQVHAMLDAAKMSSQRDYLIIKTLWETGMRASELLALTPADIERKHEVITITNGKGGKERRVLVKSETVKELFSYASQNSLGNEAKLFHLKRRQLYNIIRKYGALAGVAVHPHTLRHSFAINLVRHNTDIRRVQMLLGHSSLNVTSVYLQFKESDLKAVYDAVPF